MMPIGTGSFKLPPTVRVEALDELACAVNWKRLFIHEGPDLSPRPCVIQVDAHDDRISIVVNHCHADSFDMSSRLARKVLADLIKHFIHDKIKGHTKNLLLSIRRRGANPLI